MSPTKKIAHKISQLPPAFLIDVEQYIDSLIKKNKTKKKQRKLTQNWAGALKKYKSEYTSLALQKKALYFRFVNS